MEPRISIITLGVENLERSLAFYRDGHLWEGACGEMREFNEDGSLVIP